MSSHLSVGDDAAVKFRQREIYDERYRGEGYDARSQVRVLTAEREALNRAARRAAEANPEAAVISLIDFGYGTGRVTNEFIVAARDWAAGRPLRVIAYDVSSVGLAKAAADLLSQQFTPVGTGPVWRADHPNGYVAGSLIRVSGKDSVTVVFAHGNEDDPPDAVGQLIRRANEGDAGLITTSWYSGLGHVSRAREREQLFRVLGELTAPRGEMIVAVASLGDVVELQAEWEQRLRDDETYGFPVEAAGDVVYETELGQPNFWHVFGEDLNAHLARITSPSQQWWVEGIRYPDEEFENEAEELDNYERVAKKNREKAGTIWTTADFRELHTVAGFRSPRTGDSRSGTDPSAQRAIESTPGIKAPVRELQGESEWEPHGRVRRN